MAATDCIVVLARSRGIYVDGDLIGVNIAVVSSERVAIDTGVRFLVRIV